MHITSQNIIDYKYNQYNISSKSNVIPIHKNKADFCTFTSKPKSQPIHKAEKSVLERIIGKQYNFPIIKSKSVQQLPEEVQIDQKTANKLIKTAQQEVEKNKKNNTSRFSQAYFGTAILSSAGKTFSSGNIEINRDLTLCGEKRAIAEFIADNPYDTIQAFTLVANNIAGNESDVIMPCSSCLMWLDKLAESNPEMLKMQLITPERKNNQIILNIRTLKDILPHSGRISPSFTKKNIDDLKVSYSNLATELNNNTLSEKDVKNLLKLAKKEYLHSLEKGLAYKSGKHAGAAVITESGEIFSTGAIEVKSRDKIPADQLVLALARQNSTSKVKGIAVFSEKEKVLPNTNTFSWYDSKAICSKNLQIIEIENNEIKVGTLKDYMPFAYRG